MMVSSISYFKVYSGDSAGKSKKGEEKKEEKEEEEMMMNDIVLREKKDEKKEKFSSSDYIIEEKEDEVEIRFMKEPNKSASLSSSGIIFNNEHSDTLKIKKKDRGKKTGNMDETVKDKIYTDRERYDLDDSRAFLKDEDSLILKTDPVENYFKRSNRSKKDNRLDSGFVKVKVQQNSTMDRTEGDSPLNKKSKDKKSNRDKLVFYWSYHPSSVSEKTLRAFSEDDYNVIFKSYNGKKYPELIGYQEEIDPATNEKILYQIWSTGNEDNSNYENTDFQSNDDVQQFFEPESEHENVENFFIEKEENKNYIKIDEGLEIPREEDEIKYSSEHDNYYKFGKEVEDDEEEEEKYENSSRENVRTGLKTINTNLPSEIKRRLVLDSPGTNLSSLSLKEQSNEFLFQTREGILIESSCGTTGRNGRMSGLRNLNLGSINQSGRNDKSGLILTDERSEIGESELMRTKKKPKSQRVGTSFVTIGKKTLEKKEAVGKDDKKGNEN